jgi:hypothetical protein
VLPVVVQNPPRVRTRPNGCRLQRIQSLAEAIRSHQFRGVRSGSDEARVSWWRSALAEVKATVYMPRSAAAAVFSARSSMKSTCSGAASMILNASVNAPGSGLSRRSRQL